MSIEQHERTRPPRESDTGHPLASGDCQRVGDLSDSTGLTVWAGGTGWLAVALLAAMAGSLTYANSVFNGYCYDSIQIVQENPLVNEPGHWLDLWRVDHWYQNESRVANRDLLYRPAALLSYRIIRYIAGPQPFGQHLANVLLHAINCALLVLLAKRIGLALRVAVVASLFFAVMPIHSEVIDDIVGRSDLLVTLGITSVLLIHYRLVGCWYSHHQPDPAMQHLAFAESQDIGVGDEKVNLLTPSKRSSAVWMTIAALGTFIAMGSKESGVAVLLLVPLFDAFWFKAGRGHTLKHRWWSMGTIVRLSYLIPPTILYLVLRVNALNGVLLAAPAVSKTVNVLVDASAWQHVLGVAQLWGMYWAKMFMPLTLCVDYSINAIGLPSCVFEFHVLLGCALMIVLVGLAILAWKKRRPSVALLLLALLISYGPTANAFAIIQVYFAERLWYWPSLWASLLVGLALKPMVRGRLGIVLVGVGLALLMGRSWVRNTEWKDNGTVAASAYAVHPDSVLTLAMYGHWLVDSGETERGIGLLERAAQIDPGFTVAHRALGEAYLAIGDLRRSLDHLQKAELQFPGEPRTQQLLHYVSQQLGRVARPQLSALKDHADSRSDDLNAELGYVRALASLAMYDDLMARFNEKQSQFSSQAAWQIEYARALVLIGQVDAAIERYRHAVELDGESADSQAELAAMLMQRPQGHDLALAEKHLDKALQLSNEALSIRTLKAEWLVLMGKIDEARKIYTDVLKIAPRNHPQWGVWQARAKALGVRDAG